MARPTGTMQLIDLSQWSGDAGAAPAGQRPQPGGLGDYFGSARLRADAWFELLRGLRQWSLARGNPASRLRLSRALTRQGQALGVLEPCWSFPGAALLDDLLQQVALDNDSAVDSIARAVADGLREGACADAGAAGGGLATPCFTVLVVDDCGAAAQRELRDALAACRRADDAFRYELLYAPSLLDAWHAVLVNDDIQVVLLRDACAAATPAARRAGGLLPWLNPQRWGGAAEFTDGQDLALRLRGLRPELALLLLVDGSTDGAAARASLAGHRVIGLPRDLPEWHARLLDALATRQRAPFFQALRAYRERPMEVFHALPVSRGKALLGSRWMHDMQEFYGIDLLQAETSAVAGGLDSLLEPAGPLKQAQQAAARAFGSRQSYFVTQGTSTANKIVLHAVLRPGDIALVDRAAHKSVHYGLLLAGASVMYLDNYPLDEWGIHGGVPLRAIKSALLELRRSGRLQRVKAVVLTNCTFDGIVYNPALVMQECLAIKPDLVFVWDEAWFAFARFDPLYRQRTAMEAAERLCQRHADPDYRARYQAWREGFDTTSEQAWLDTTLLPDPAQARVRVYATQSTHKTMTALRQGSMIHVHDQDFERQVGEAFHEAYMVHTSTSPNYPILASLDLARRQGELEGRARVRAQVDAALELRRALALQPGLDAVFRVLEPQDMIPAGLRASGLADCSVARAADGVWQRAWADDEFVLDPCRMTLELRAQDVGGDALRNEHLQARGIQVNKTTLNTVLLMTHFGTTQVSVAALIEALTSIAAELRGQDPREARTPSRASSRLPAMARFHRRFEIDPASCAGDLRAAAYLSYAETNCEYFDLRDPALDALLARGRELVSAGFVVPYPPGWPLLVPGQVLRADMLGFLRSLDVKEIHGIDPRRGLRVFRSEVLREAPAAHGAAARPRTARRVQPAAVAVAAPAPAAGAQPGLTAR